MRTIRLLLALTLLTSLTLFLVACDTAEAPSPTAAPATPTPPTTPSGEAAITIESPAEGETVMVPVRVAGTASVFEATLMVEVRDSQGRVLCGVVTMASEGAPGRGDYEVSLGFPPPEEETNAEVVAYTRSPKDGSIQDTVTVPVTLSPEAPPVVLTSPLCGQEVNVPVTVEGTTAPGTEVEITVGGLFGAELGRTTVEADAQGSFSGEVTLPALDEAQRGVIVARQPLWASYGDPNMLFSVPVVLIP